MPGDGGGQGSCRGISRRMQGTRRLQKGTLEPRGFDCHRIEPAVAAGQVGHLVCQLFSELPEILCGHTMLSGNLDDRGEPRFHMVLPRRIVFEVAESAADLFDRIAEQDLCLLKGLNGREQLRVEGGKGLQLAQRGPDSVVGRNLLGVVQPFYGFVQSRCDPSRIREQQPLLFQRLRLAGLQIECLQLAQLIAEQIQPRLPGALAPQERPSFRIKRRPLAMQPGNVRQQRFMPAVRIEDLALSRALHQRLVGMLAADFEQLSAEVTQRFHRHRLAVYVAAGPALGRHDPADVTLPGNHRDPLARSHVSAGDPGATAKIAVISARSVPARTAVLSARSPSASASASTSMDLPAPVSPVSTVKPGSRSSSISSSTARWRMCRRVSMAYSGAATARGMVVPSPVQLVTQNLEVVIAARMYQFNALIGGAHPQAPARQEIRR